jgi:hypothetical protein
VDVRRLLLVALLAGLVSTLPVRAQTNVPTASALPIGLGFSQASVAPTTAGVPVYTAGDQLWFKSYAPGMVNVTVTPPGSGAAVFRSLADIPSNTSELLLTFSSTDPAGTWSLNATSLTGTVAIHLLFVVGGASATLTGYGVGDDGDLVMNYTLDAPSAYGVSACAFGNQSTATAYVPVPSSVGGGTLLLNLTGSTVSVIPQETTSQFTFWLELSQDYAFQVNGSSAVVTREMEVAQTQPARISVGLSGSFSTALQDELPMRTGQFGLTAEFESAKGVSTYDTSILITGTGPWIWLESCPTSVDSVSTAVTVNASLRAGVSVWPRVVYMLYHEEGIELYSAIPATVRPAAVTMVASRWGEPLTESQIEVSGASEYAAGNGTVYLASANYPADISVATPQTNPQGVEVARPYSVLQVQVPADQIVVKVTSGGTAISGARVTLADSEGTVSTEESSAGQAVFYVPPGNYTVLATLDGNAENATITTYESEGAGRSLSVALQLGQNYDATLTYVIVITTIIGMIVSGILWTTIFRRRLALKAAESSRRTAGSI